MKALERVCITRSEIEGIDTLCSGIITVRGEEQPCCKPAVSLIYDAESAGVWAACSWHAHRYGGALTLAQIREAIETGATHFEREVSW